MQKEHRYQLETIWEGNLGTGTSAYAAYGRDYRVRVPGKAELAGSADPSFRGTADRHDPEDQLLAALSACHMLTYLHACATAKVIVLEYTDAAEGVMVLDGKGGGRFERVMLRPRVVVAEAAMIATAERLHERAGEMCFIRSSVNFPVDHKAQTTSAPN